jgi:hypothetical protein
MKFSDKRAEDRFHLLHPKAVQILTEMDDYAQEKYNVELTVTETVTTKAEDKALNRVSTTHAECRAWDIRTRDLPESLIAELCAVFRKKYGKLGAVVKGQPQLIVYRPHGNGPHLHCQLNRSYSRISKLDP